MISRETRASSLLRQLSRARPMTAADLVVVSEAHMQLGSHSTGHGCPINVVLLTLRGEYNLAIHIHSVC